jgi:uncharacterized protein (DUF2164 family)
MEKVKRSWDLISQDKRKSAIENIIYYFKKERNQDIGIIGAEQILDFFLQDVGMELYNKGVEDSKQLLKNRFEDLELDMDVLLKNK